MCVIGFMNQHYSNSLEFTFFQKTQDPKNTASKKTTKASHVSKVDFIVNVELQVLMVI